MTPEDIPGRLGNLEAAVERLTDRVEDIENEREAIALLPERVSDLRDFMVDVRNLVKAFREDCNSRLDALTRKRADGTLEASPGRLDIKTWISIAGLVAGPVLVVALSKL